MQIENKLAEGALHYCVLITGGNIEQDLPKNWAPGNTCGDHSPSRCSSISYTAAIEPAHHPAQCELVYVTVGQFV